MYTMDLHPALGDRLDDFLTTKLVVRYKGF